MNSEFTPDKKEVFLRFILLSEEDSKIYFNINLQKSTIKFII